MIKLSQMKKYLEDYFDLLKFLKPFISLLLIAIICMAVSSIFDGISLSMIIPVTDRLLSNKKIILPANIINIFAFLKPVIDKLNSLSPFLILKFVPVVAMVLFFLKGLFNFLQNYLMNLISQKVIMDIKNKLYKKFQELSLEFYANRRTGELISRIINDVNFISNSLSYALTDLIYESMQLFIFSIITFYLGIGISWRLFIVFIIFPMIIIPVIKVGKRIKKYSLEIQKKIADLTSILNETIQGAYIVKIFCRENYEINRFKEINRAYYKFTMKSIKRMIVLSPLTEFLGAIGAVMILSIGGKEVISGKISFGVFALFMASLMSMIRPLKKLSNVFAINQQAIPASKRIYEILNEEPKIKEISNPKVISDFKDKIIYEDVWFKYNQNEDFVLREINLEVKKNQIVALVGHSGAGKSTLMSLLPRLYDPTRGRILIDGIDIKDLSLNSLRSLISIVSQDMVLFNASIYDNIAYGKENALSQEVIEAAKRANAYDFIIDLPHKFNTIIGDRGLRLSGGEKQKIAIARAILKDAPILILDEATSQMDSESEGLLKEAIYNLMRGKTVFVIAHRLSTVKKADRIVVLEKGKIVEVGTHDELVLKNTVYKRLCELQFNM